MNFEKLRDLNREIMATEKCRKGPRTPVINELRKSQRYLIISSDPSAETDKSKKVLEKHSGFEERIISLVFFGSDDAKALESVRHQYGKLKNKFLDNFYWTHYSKCYSSGDPDSFWADKFLKREIELFEPKLMILFGSKPADFLLGSGNLKDRVNQILDWESIPLICCLHPSRDWNMQRRDEYDFNETWELIRSNLNLR